ncbi:MAG: hypothetical protein QW786_03605 [Candidatus Hadarchaeum sp.]
MFTSGGNNLKEQGLGYTADFLILAILVSLCFVLLFNFNQADAGIITERYAASFARNTLLALLNCTADQFGGFNYRAGFQIPELELPMVQHLILKKFRHKNIGQLLVEDVMLNMQLRISDKTAVTIWSNEDMHQQLTALLKSTLDNIVGNRFGYRFSAAAKPAEAYLVGLDFNLTIENLSPSGVRLCSETVLLSLPVSGAELMNLLRERVGFTLSLPLETDTTIEVKLELWSR